MSPTLILAFVLMAEAGCQGTQGRALVADVITNRAEAKKINAVEVVLAHKQFSCLNGLKRQEMDDRMHKYAVQNPKIWRECIDIAHKLVSGSWEAKTSFNHYYNPALCSPSWGTKMVQAKQFGDHLFGVL